MSVYHITPGSIAEVECNVEISSRIEVKQQGCADVELPALPVGIRHAAHSQCQTHTSLGHKAAKQEQSHRHSNTEGKQYLYDNGNITITKITLSFIALF